MKTVFWLTVPCAFRNVKTSVGPVPTHETMKHILHAGTWNVWSQWCDRHEP